MWEQILAALVSIQTAIKQSIADDLVAFSSSRDWVQLAYVFPLGIMFGAVHALTPGHSKLVLASYVAGSGETAARSIRIAAILSFTHILSAVAIAMLTLPLISRNLVDAGQSPILDDLSRALLAVIGLWMIARAWRSSAHAHNEAAWFGVAAGLIPCPLTLFAMVFAIARGVPEAGLLFALSMLLGVTLTLSAIAVLSAFARNQLQHVIVQHGGTLQTFSRSLEAATGLLLVIIGVREVWLR